MKLFLANSKFVEPKTAVIWISFFAVISIIMSTCLNDTKWYVLFLPALLTVRSKHFKMYLYLFIVSCIVAAIVLFATFQDVGDVFYILFLWNFVGFVLLFYSKGIVQSDDLIPTFDDKLPINDDSKMQVALQKGVSSTFLEKSFFEFKIGFFSWNLTANKVEISPFVSAMFHFQKEEQFINFTDWEKCFLNVEEREKFNKSMFGALLSTTGFNEILNFTTIQGVTKYFKFEGKVLFDENKNPTFFNGVILDQTELIVEKAAMIEYTESLEKMVERKSDVLSELSKNFSKNERILQSISEISNIGSWNLDIATQRIDISEQMFHIHELPVGPTPSLETLLNFYLPEGRGIVLKNLKNCEKNRKPFEFELPLQTNTGKIIWVRIKGRAIVIDGIVTGINGIIQDISGDKHFRENLIRINEQLDLRIHKTENELVKSVDELASLTYIISHDLRAPLRAIEGFSLALQGNFSTLLDEQGNKWLSYILSNTSKMENLIHDILLFSRVGRTVVQPIEINMNKLIEEKFDDLKTIYQFKTIKLNVEKLPNCIGDRFLIGHLWNSLIHNALKFSSNNDEAEIEILGNIQDGYAVYMLKDSGVGFDERYISKMFVLFQRLHGQDEFKGSGVGLAIAQCVIEKHNGWIKASSQLGKGASFEFGLPI